MPFELNQEKLVKLEAAAEVLAELGQQNEITAEEKQAYKGPLFMQKLAKDMDGTTVAKALNIIDHVIAKAHIIAEVE